MTAIVHQDLLFPPGPTLATLGSSSSKPALPPRSQKLTTALRLFRALSPRSLPSPCLFPPTGPSLSSVYYYSPLKASFTSLLRVGPGASPLRGVSRASHRRSLVASCQVAPERGPNANKRFPQRINDTPSRLDFTDTGRPSACPHLTPPSCVPDNTGSKSSPTFSVSQPHVHRALLPWMNSPLASLPKSRPAQAHPSHVQTNDLHGLIHTHILPLISGAATSAEDIPALNVSILSVLWAASFVFPPP